MPASFRAVQSGTGSGTSVSATKPTGTTSGDLVVVWIALAANGITYTPPSGFTQRFSQDNQASGSLIGVNLACFTKVAGGSEPASYSFTISGSTAFAWIAEAYQSENQSNPINVQAVNVATSAGTTLTTTAVTPTVDNGLVIYGGAGSALLSSAPTITWGSGVTQQASIRGTAGLSNNAGVASARDDTLAGLTATTSRSATASGSTSWVTGALVVQRLPVTTSQSGSASLSLTASKGSTQVNVARSAALSLSAATNRTITAARSFASALSLATTIQRQISLPRSVSLTLATTVVKLTATAKSVALTLTAANTKRVILTAKVAALSLTATANRQLSMRRAFSVALTLGTVFNRAIIFGRQFSVSLSLAASGRVDMALSVLNRITGGGGTTIVKKILQVFDD